MDLQQNGASESKKVLAVFDGLLPMVRHFFYVMISDSCIVLKHASVGIQIIRIFFRKLDVTLKQILVLQTYQMMFEVSLS